MSSEATSPQQRSTRPSHVASSPSSEKGKGKATADQSMGEEEDEDEDEEDEGEEEEDDDDGEDEFEEIDPSAILPTSRRTRGIRVDYTSKEALERAGITENDKEDDEDGDVEMKD